MVWTNDCTDFLRKFLIIWLIILVKIWLSGGHPLILVLIFCLIRVKISSIGKRVLRMMTSLILLISFRENLIVSSLDDLIVLKVLSSVLLWENSLLFPV